MSVQYLLSFSSVSGLYPNLRELSDSIVAKMLHYAHSLVSNCVRLMFDAEPDCCNERAKTRTVQLCETMSLKSI